MHIISNIEKSVKSGSGKLHFIFGAAGTGKTTTIKEINDSFNKSVIVAPTGISALTANGSTIHSFFQLAPTIKPKIKKIKGPSIQKVIEKLECLIIDEISMVRADLLDAISDRLKDIKSSQEPFGGISVIITGDPYQLEPVLTNDEEPHFFHGNEYKGPFFFQSKVFKEIYRKGDFNPHQLVKSYRSSKDEDFTILLNNIREGNDLRRAVNKFNEVCKKDSTINNDSVVFLTSRNSDAERINNKKLEELESEKKVYIATVEKFYDPKNYPAPERLELKVGAKIIFIKNDEENRWVNGSQGTIVNLPKDESFIQIEVNGEKHDVSRDVWEKNKYIYDEELDEFYTEVAGSFSQFPIRLGWAITIHRSQSLTLDKCAIDFGSGAFAHGQAYVALSRCRSIDDIYLLNDIKVSDIKVDQRVKEFFKSIKFLNKNKDSEEMKTSENSDPLEEINKQLIEENLKLKSKISLLEGKKTLNKDKKDTYEGKRKKTNDQKAWKLIDIKEWIKSDDNQVDIVMIQQGYYFAAFEEDAELLEEENGNTPFRLSENSRLQAGFLVKSIEKYINLFEKKNFKYVIVEQTGEKTPKGMMIRKITRPYEGRTFP